MRRVGLFQAKNELSALVERAYRGEEIMITRRGQEAAMLVPARKRSQRTARDVVEIFARPERRSFARRLHAETAG